MTDPYLDTLDRIDKLVARIDITKEVRSLK